MAEPVYVIGAARTDFQRNFKKEGKTIRDVILEAAQGAVANAGIDPGDIQAGVVGNFASGLFSRQLHLGAFLVELDPRLRGIPTFHVEAACASGGVAVLCAAQQIMGGLHDLALVVGAEQQKTMPPEDGADVLGAAGDYQTERAQYGEFLFPKLFAHIAQIYRERHGLTDQHLALVAVKNRAHARLNPLAQMRDRPLSLKEACAESEANPRIAPPLKLTDCSPITDGGAGLVLCSDRFLRKLARRPVVRLLGYGHTTDQLPLDRKDAPDFSVARRAAERAYGIARVSPHDIQAAEVHDCFSISEIIAYEILGFAGRGGGAQLLESGATMQPAVKDSILGTRQSRPGDQGSKGTPVVNPGGGLMGDGHPVGATGVRQVVEAFRQLTRSAGEHQVESVERALTFNMGGSVTTSVVMIWGAGA